MYYEPGQQHVEVYIVVDCLVWIWIKGHSCMCCHRGNESFLIRISIPWLTWQPSAALRKPRTEGEAGAAPVMIIRSLPPRLAWGQREREREREAWSGQVMFKESQRCRICQQGWTNGFLMRQWTLGLQRHRGLVCILSFFSCRAALYFKKVK